MPDAKPLEPGRFYTNSEGTKAMCLKVQNGKMMMCAFGQAPDGRPIEVQYVQDVKYASLYTPITDPDAIAYRNGITAGQKGVQVIRKGKSRRRGVPAEAK